MPDSSATPDPELEQAILGVTTFEPANDAPAVVEDGPTDTWRGVVTSPARS